MAADPEHALAFRRILLVDDQPSIRGVLEMALTRAGADVWIAADGAAALERAEKAQPDLILLDLQMPGMNGWDVLREFRLRPALASIPVVLQSSQSDYASFDHARKQGVAAFLSKPYRIPEVLETCRRILKGARPLQGREAAEDDDHMLVQVRNGDGNLLAVGHMLDQAGAGAQIELDQPLALGRMVTIHFNRGDGIESQEAEVRWVSGSAGLYQHGLAFTRARTR